MTARIKLLTSNSVHGVLDELLPRFEGARGHKVEVSYDPAKVMLARIRAGETADLAILGASAIDALVKEGRIVAASRRELARCGVGVGVRKGAPRPDIGSVEAFKQALLGAKSIAYTLEGASGIHFAGLIERLGIAAQVRAKARTQAGGLVGELVARGEAELAVQQIPEIMAVPGVDYAGPLPKALQLITTSAAGIFADAAQPDGARALLDFLAAPASARVFEAKGLEPSRG
ncbi:MAG: substrate-binding domain-containing protein [Betaproteobacteria bacterium]|nr:substrate-binding domain-containing protein [Betaproteobacteria bacterium]